MIRTEKEYTVALQKLKQNEETIHEQRKLLIAMEMTEEQMELVLSPLESFYHQLEQEIKTFERIKAKDWEFIEQLANLQHIGQLFIALRIAYGLTQRDFAKLLGITEAQVSKDERNEYHGISLERAIRIFEALRIQPVQLNFDPRLSRDLLLRK